MRSRTSSFLSVRSLSCRALGYSVVLASIFCGLFAGCSGNNEELLISPSDELYLPAGRTLVQGLAACAACHGSSASPRSSLSGGLVFKDLYGEITAPNLVSSEIGEWELGDFVNAVRKSELPSGDPFAAEHHAGYEWMSDEDAFAIAAYVQSLPRSEKEIPRRDISTLDRYTSGLLEQRRSVSGYVPSIPKRDPKAFGKYLVDHIARCSSCHNGPDSLFSEVEYLKGGREMKRGSKTHIAPNITGSETFGIGEWSQDEIVGYLSTGKPPGSAFKQSELCPTDFYGLAPREDLEAIARYLRSVENT